MLRAGQSSAPSLGSTITAAWLRISKCYHLVDGIPLRSFRAAVGARTSSVGIGSRKRQPTAPCRLWPDRIGNPRPNP